MDRASWLMSDNGSILLRLSNISDKLFGAVVTGIVCTSLRERYTDGDVWNRLWHF